MKKEFIIVSLILVLASIVLLLVSSHNFHCLRYKHNASQKAYARFRLYGRLCLIVGITCALSAFIILGFAIVKHYH